MRIEQSCCVCWAVWGKILAPVDRRIHDGWAIGLKTVGPDLRISGERSCRASFGTRQRRLCLGKIFSAISLLCVAATVAPVACRAALVYDHSQPVEGSVYSYSHPHFGQNVELTMPSRLTSMTIVFTSSSPQSVSLNVSIHHTDGLQSTPGEVIWSGNAVAALSPTPTPVTWNLPLVAVPQQIAFVTGLFPPQRLMEGSGSVGTAGHLFDDSEGFFQAVAHPSFAVKFEGIEIPEPKTALLIVGAAMSALGDMRRR
jgi:hypothetical protein